MRFGPRILNIPVYRNYWPACTSCGTRENALGRPESVLQVAYSPDRSALCTNAELRCLSGPHKGEPCSGTHLCDDLCDACPVKGGVTTDDEMFILLGAYFCPENTSCYQPVP